MLIRHLVEDLPKVERLLARLVFVDGLTLTEAGDWLRADRTEALRLYRRVVRWLEKPDLLPEHVV